jgi:hypothetical protein
VSSAWRPVGTDEHPTWFVGGGGQLPPARDRHFEDGDATVGVLAAQKEVNTERNDPDSLFRRIDCGLRCHEIELRAVPVRLHNQRTPEMHPRASELFELPSSSI